MRHSAPCSSRQYEGSMADSSIKYLMGATIEISRLYALEASCREISAWWAEASLYFDIHGRRHCIDNKRKQIMTHLHKWNCLRPFRYFWWKSLIRLFKYWISISPGKRRAERYFDISHGPPDIGPWPVAARLLMVLEGDDQSRLILPKPGVYYNWWL